MYKFLSILCVLVVAFSFSSTAYADDCIDPDAKTVTIIKDYQSPNNDTTSPAETFTFTIEKQSVTDAAEGVTVDNMPVPTISNVSYASGDAGSTHAKKPIAITLPDYPSVGIYTYSIHEDCGQSAGVTYRNDPILLRVTVIQDSTGLTPIAAIHTESSSCQKSDTFANIYSAGTLCITKNVTGNLGDQAKNFTITVTFYAPQGKTVNEAITYMDGSTTCSIASGWSVKESVDIQLKHGETITFQNIPYGVSYHVTEKDYTPEGYEVAQYDFSDPNKTIDSPQDTVAVTNNKNINVDTGIHLDSIPYLIILAVIVCAVLVYGKNKYFYNKQ